MPFTFAHPAAAVIVRRAIRRGWLPLAPFAIGAMSPDFEYVLRLEPWARLGHTWPGIATFSLPVALAVVAWWEWQGGEAIRALAGLESSAARLLRAWPARRVTTIVAATTLGVATHIAWDGFTHWDGWAATLFPVIAERVTRAAPQFLWANVFQHTSTLVGSAVVLTWYYRQLQSRSVSSRLLSASRIKALVAIALPTLAIALWNAPRAGTITDTFQLKIIAGRFVVGAMAGLAIALVGYAFWWRSTGPRAFHEHETAPAIDR
ncbi:MAG: DUF4184 family protein [Gemmatimonadaceae bacterium]